MSIREINPTHTDRRSDPHQVRPRHQAAIGHRPEIVHFQFDGGEAPRPAKMVIQCDADRGIRDTCGHTAMQHSRAIEKIGAKAALDRDPVAMFANQFESEQVVERMPGPEILLAFGSFLRRLQVR